MSDCHSHHTNPSSLVEVKGTVVRLEGNKAVVKLDAQEGCGRCHEPGGCGGQSLTKMSDAVRMYELPNTLGAKVDDRVCLEIEPDLVRQAALTTYVFPLLLCFTGALIGQWQGGDLVAVLGALVGLVLGWIVLKSSRSFLAAGNAGNSAKENDGSVGYVRMRFDR